MFLKKEPVDSNSRLQPTKLVIQHTSLPEAYLPKII